MLFGLLALAAAATAIGSPEASTPHVKVRILAEQAVAAPGQSFTLAFHQSIIDHWHTYWENPGDSGEPVQLTWKLPDGVEAGAIQWPTPEAIPVGPLMNYGYSHEVSFLTAFTLAPDWPAGEPIDITVDAYWLVCEEACIPESAVLELQLPTGPIARLDDGVSELFAAARASQPAPLTVVGEFAVGEDSILLSFPLDARPDAGRAPAEARFFPASWGVLDHAADQQPTLLDGILTLRAPLGDAPPREAVRGILRVGGDAAYALEVSPGGTGGVLATERAAESMGLLLALAAALLGGLILNLMPCVFPVLALKAFGLLQHADADSRERLTGGVAYTLGIILSFLALGGALLGLRAGGEAIGWGFQLQSPAIVMGLALVIFAVGLSLSGVFSLGYGLTQVDHAAAGRSDWIGSFATGVLAAVVAAPCTAPFMAAATGAALVRPPVEALAIFSALGLGLAAPYLLLTAVPSAARLLPRPGAWMEALKKLMAFPMYGAAIWLVWVLAQQSGPDAVLIALSGCLVVGLAAWMWDAAREAPLRQGMAVLLAIAALGLAGALPAAAPGNGAAPAETAVDYDADRLKSLTSAGQTVFLNLTAAWCITCKVNERVALDTDEFRALVARDDVTYMRGDWTTRDPAITAVLEAFGRAGVPLYIVYRPDGSTEVLPQVLTPGIVIDAITS
ncbi:MAG: protein-disulfide reductase DsbD domain-containing protein [Pseudomonadota bacterium]